MQNTFLQSSKLLSLAAISVGLLFGATSQAWAHAHVVKTMPEADATVEQVDNVCIEFNSPLEPAFSKLDVFDANTDKVNTEKSAMQNADNKTMCVASQNLQAGAYTAQWVAVAADGHKVKGEFKFNIK